MKTAIVLLGSLLLIFLISGCELRYDKTSIEDLALAGVIGFDTAPGGQLKVTVSIPQTSKEQKEEDLTLTTEVTAAHQIISKLSAMSNKTVSLRQVRVLLFGEEYARTNGLKAIVEQLYRDPQMGSNIYVAVVKGTAQDLLEVKPSIKQKSIYLNNLLRPTEETAFSPFVTIRDFIYIVTNEVSDPIVPYLEKKESHIQMSKIGLFKEDKLIDFISPEEARIAEVMRRKKRLPDITVNTEAAEGSPQSFVVIDFVEGKNHVKASIRVDDPTITIKINLTGTIQDYKDGLNLTNPRDRQTLENASNKDIEKRARALLQKFQKLQIDPIGIGMHVRSHYSGKWSKDRWIKGFAKADIDVMVKTKLVNSGTLK